MSKCTDDNLGRLQHDYELGLLSDEDKAQFELHLYDCEHCLEQIRDFADASHILAEDPEARSIIQSLGAEGESGERIKSKGKISPFVKLLLVAALVVVVAVPSVRYFQGDEEAITQTLEFLPTRTAGSDVVYLDRGGTVELRFFIKETHRANTSVKLESIEGVMIKEIDDYTDISTDGFGTLLIPISEFADGHYILMISTTDAPDTVRDTQYMFRVK